MLSIIKAVNTFFSFCQKKHFFVVAKIIARYTSEVGGLCLRPALRVWYPSQQSGFGNVLWLCERLPCGQVAQELSGMCLLVLVSLKIISEKSFYKEKQSF